MQFLYGANFKRNEEEQVLEQQQQQQEEREKKFTVAIEKASHVIPSCLDSEGEKDISKKSTERQQQKQETTETKNPTYSAKWLTAKDITFPSNRECVSSSSVISIHSCFSGLDSLKRCEHSLRTYRCLSCGVHSATNEVKPQLALENPLLLNLLFAESVLAKFAFAQMAFGKPLVAKTENDYNKR